MINDVNKKKLVLFDIDYTLFNTASFKKSDLSQYELYQEVIEVLEKVSKIAQLGIFSEGNNDFQRKKLLKTGILQHFTKDKIHIVENKEDFIDGIIKSYKDFKIFLVDDKIDILIQAKECDSSVYAIWVKRGPYAEDVELKDFRPDSVLTQLADLENVIKKYGKK
jgi:FMN phosphatase YigB (HAD superfamily)